jgi:hypothetical protein
MHATSRATLVPLLLAVLTWSPPGAAAAPPTEIRLGKAIAPAPKADPVQIRAVERFFAARQSASMDRSRLAAARKMVTGGATMDAAMLAGGPGQVLVAFDFTDGAIERLGNGRFRVAVYSLFADRQGRVVESRDEVLTFAAPMCTSLQVAGTMRWGTEEVAKTANRLHVSQALERADEFLRGWATRQTSLAAYSIEDVYPTGVNRVMIPCLQFSASPGTRGYDVVDAPIMIRRGPKGFQLEPQAN